MAAVSARSITHPYGHQLGLLRRLNTFSLPEITTATHPEPVSNDPIIRKLTFLSLLAVYKDIIPGYRIRALTDMEKAEKVSQMVQRTRDWEQGLVHVYQVYLRTLETELKGKVQLALSQAVIDYNRIISQKRSSRSCVTMHVHSSRRGDAFQLPH